MGGQELGQDFAVPQLEAAQLRAAAVHVADRVAVENPHPLDGSEPRLAGRLIGRDPVIAAGLIELLDALGLLPAHYARLRARETELTAQIAAATSTNQRLKGER